MTGPSVNDPTTGLIGITLCIANPSMEEPCMSKAKETKAHAKEAEAHASEAMQTKLCASEATKIEGDQKLWNQKVDHRLHKEMLENQKVSYKLHKEKLQN